MRLPPPPPSERFDPSHCRLNQSSLRDRWMKPWCQSIQTHNQNRSWLWRVEAEHPVFSSCLCEYLLFRGQVVGGCDGCVVQLKLQHLTAAEEKVRDPAARRLVSSLLSHSLCVLFLQPRPLCDKINLSWFQSGGKRLRATSGRTLRQRESLGEQNWVNEINRWTKMYEDCQVSNKIIKN